MKDFQVCSNEVTFISLCKDNDYILNLSSNLLINDNLNPIIFGMWHNKQDFLEVLQPLMNSHNYMFDILSYKIIKVDTIITPPFTL